MTMMISTICGTNHAEGILVDDVGKYNGWHGTHATKEEFDKAIALLDETMDDATFANDGHRNEDAVNSCIALHVLGYDPEMWFNDFFDKNNSDGKFSNTDIWKFMEHVERVCGYLYKWGPVGDEGAALKYAI